VSTFVTFQPSTTAAFSFPLTLTGTPYVATITWNVFGERYYLNLADLSGNPVLCRALVSSGPRYQASFNWANGTATATIVGAHNVPVGNVVDVRTSQTGTPFDGEYRALSTGPNTLTYPIQVNPQVPTPQNGTLSFDLNLVAEVLDPSGNPIVGWLLYHCDTQQFEFES
jgi:hypothetical protein